MKERLHLFEGYGIELEYMLADGGDLHVLPMADEVFRAAKGTYTNEVVAGLMGWSNEFALHVVEIRNVRPTADLASLPALFGGEVDRINRIIEARGAMLMPSAMHPLMEPEREAVLWRRKNKKIYETYDRIFGCRTHGWSNIQSMQVNLPFQGNSEFRRLHAALRMILPLVPALAASSPIVEGKANGVMDNRLLHYRLNQKRVPSIIGDVIPETVLTKADYRKDILKQMYEDIAPLDPEGVLKHEWLNSRAAIPRFDRSAMEVRLPDIQECPAADVAVAAAIIGAAKALAEERWVPVKELHNWAARPLVAILDEASAHAEEAVIRESLYLKCLGYPEPGARAGDIWRHLAQETLNEQWAGGAAGPLGVILDKGTLSTRILRATGAEPQRGRIIEVYRELCRCLSEGRMFDA